MKVLTGTIFLVLIAILGTGSKTTARSGKAILPTATCFCKISYNDLTNQKSASGVCLDLTGAVNKTYTGINPQKDANQTDCNTKCTAAAASHTGSQSMASCACAAGKPSGTVVRAWSAVGVREYKSAQQIGILTNQPQVSQTTCTCPPTWASNTTHANGGVTTDGKCKKLACSSISITPLPANGTQLGNWGFTWGNSLIAWGTSANGGAPNCVTSVISGAVCKF
ncbi:MAG TPA: hypothetical protein VNO50_11635 [Pyrinomonadaceae bacterium]|nr:hypothetical protein [Pyrinomonadaceae bacterium]